MERLRKLLFELSSNERISVRLEIRNRVRMVSNGSVSIVSTIGTRDESTYYEGCFHILDYSAMVGKC